MKKRSSIAAVVVATALVWLLTLAAASEASPPPGATALCKDGSYSFSQHHSGTCSHHGGVAKWLDASGSTSTSKSTTSTASTPSTGGPNLGKTVLLAARTKTSGCTLAALPDRACSPGAYYTGLTKSVICSSTFRTSTIRNVPTSEKHQVEVEYGLVPKSYGSTLEIDHIVSLELGGSNDIANLFPEKATLPGKAPGFRIKDKLENVAHDWVCQGKISLRSAQKKIASNWEALYRQIYGVAPTG